MIIFLYDLERDDTRVSPRLAKVTFISPVTFQCDSAIEAVWFFNYEELPEIWFQKEKVVRGENSLNIKRSKAGTYNCFGYNTDIDKYFLATGIYAPLGK